jgi:hypothetical protein
MCILCVYTRNTPCYTRFYNQLPFTLHVISLMDQWILLKWFLLNFCIICCSNWKSSAGVQFITYSNRRAVCCDIAKKTHLTSALYSVWWWRLMRPNTMILLSTTRLQLDADERVPSFIADHVQLHKIIPLFRPFLISPSSHQAIKQT